MTETLQAVVDRIVDGETVVLVIEADGAVIDEIHRPLEDMVNGVEEGMIFDVQAAEDGYHLGRAHPEATEERRQNLKGRFDRLSKRLGEDEE